MTIYTVGAPAISARIRSARNRCQNIRDGVVWIASAALLREGAVNTAVTTVFL